MLRVRLPLQAPFYEKDLPSLKQGPRRGIVVETPSETQQAPGLEVYKEAGKRRDQADCRRIICGRSPIGRRRQVESLNSVGSTPSVRTMPR